MDEVLYTWGFGKYGQLGHGDECSHSVPKALDRVSLAGQVLSDLSCGFCFNIGVTKKGDVFTWGLGKQMQLGHPELSFTVISRPRKVKFFMKKFVVAVAAGREHSVAVLSTGEVYSWGCGVYGKLGQGHQEDREEPCQVVFVDNEDMLTSSFGRSIRSLPRKITEVDENIEEDDFSPARVEKNIRIVAVACGFHHTLALSDEGKVYSWGLGLSGRLGHGDEEDQYRPKLVKALAQQDVSIKTVRCGWDHSAVIAEGRGHVYTWGCGKSYQLGGVSLGGRKGGVEHRNVPTKVIQWVERQGKNSNELKYLSKPPKITELCCGGKHNLALTEDGNIFSWGRGEFGRLGHGDQRHKVFPTRISSLDEKIVSVAAGGYHSLAMTDGGVVFVWGNNEEDRLGLGTANETCLRPTPLPSTVPNNKARIKATKIFAGAYISVAFGSASNTHGHTSVYNQCVIM